MPSILTFFRANLLKSYEILLKAISASVKIILLFLSLSLLVFWVIIVDLHMLNKLWILKGNNLVTAYTLNMLLNLICNYLLRTFTSIIIRRMDIFVVSLIRFWYQCNSFIEWVQWQSNMRITHVILAHGRWKEEKSGLAYTF